MTGRVLYEVTPMPGGGWTISRPWAQCVEEFRAERIGRIAQGNGPVILEDGPVAVLHFVPHVPLDNGFSIDFSRLAGRNAELLPLGSGGYNNRFNADGFICASSNSDGRSEAYLQVFRNGTIETASTRFSNALTGRTVIASLLFEEEVIHSATRAVKLAKEMDFPAPWSVGIGLARVEQVFMASPRSSFHMGRGEYPIDREVLSAPVIVIHDAGTDIPTALRPAFDYLWQAVGWERSLYYNADGTRSRG